MGEYLRRNHDPSLWSNMATSTENLDRTKTSEESWIECFHVVDAVLTKVIQVQRLHMSLFCEFVTFSDTYKRKDTVEKQRKECEHLEEEMRSLMKKMLDRIMSSKTGGPNVSVLPHTEESVSPFLIPEPSTSEFDPLLEIKQENDAEMVDQNDSNVEFSCSRILERNQNSSRFLDETVPAEDKIEPSHDSEFVRPKECNSPCDEFSMHSEEYIVNEILPHAYENSCEKSILKGTIYGHSTGTESLSLIPSTSQAHLVSSKKQTPKENMEAPAKTKVRAGKRRQTYSPMKLQEALSCIEGKRMSIGQVSRQFNIPRTTLLYKTKGQRPSAYVKPGPQPMLGKENEDILVKWVEQHSKKGFPLTREALCYSANELLKQGHGKLVNTFNADKGPSRTWFEGFMRRHPHLKLRSPENLHNGKTKVNETIIRNWFQQVSEDLKNHLDIFKEPQRILNCDETTIFLQPKSRPVIATKGQKKEYDASGTSDKENLTILITGNAAGDIAPPLALVSYKNIPADVAAIANPEWSIGMTENGLMTCQSFFEYVANVLEPYLENVTKPVILFLDGHSSHVSLQLSEFCREKQIILVALPPNATHVLQPLDVSFFAPLKKTWNIELEAFKLGKNIEPGKCHVLPILEAFLSQPNFKTNLIKSFENCGLYPFSPELVDYTKCKTRKQKHMEVSVYHNETENF